MAILVGVGEYVDFGGGGGLAILAGVGDHGDFGGGGGLW